MSDKAQQLVNLLTAQDIIINAVNIILWLAVGIMIFGFIYKARKMFAQFDEDTSKQDDANDALAEPVTADKQDRGMFPKPIRRIVLVIVVISCVLTLATMPMMSASYDIYQGLSEEEQSQVWEALGASSDEAEQLKGIAKKSIWDESPSVFNRSGNSGADKDAHVSDVWG